MMIVIPIEKIGGSLSRRVNATYDELVEKIGFEPNATHLDDSDKVKASWGFEDELGRKAFVWSYKHNNPRRCTLWSTDWEDGGEHLLEELGILK